MPFKWNAFRVQLIGDKGGTGGVGGGGGAAGGGGGGGGNGPPAHTPPDRGRQPVSVRGAMSGEQSWAQKSLDKSPMITHPNDSRSRDFRPCNLFLEVKSSS